MRYVPGLLAVLAVACTHDTTPSSGSTNPSVRSAARVRSMLLVEMDDPEALARAGGTRALVDAMFAPGNVFSDRYLALAASTPGVTHAHAATMKLLDALPRS
jgi:hypothetical protein